MSQSTRLGTPTLVQVLLLEGKTYPLAAEPAESVRRQ